MIKANFNTKEKGYLNYFMFEDEQGMFTAACLNLNIIEYGEDPEKLKLSIEEAANSYLNSVRAKNLSDELLNQVPDKEILEKLKELEYLEELQRNAFRQPEPSPSPAPPTYFNLSNIPYAKGRMLHL